MHINKHVEISLDYNYRHRWCILLIGLSSLEGRSYLISHWIPGHPSHRFWITWSDVKRSIFVGTPTKYTRRGFSSSELATRYSIASRKTSRPFSTSRRPKKAILWNYSSEKKRKEVGWWWGLLMFGSNEGHRYSCLNSYLCMHSFLKLGYIACSIKRK